MPTVSVIVCTHNPRRDYLRRTLDALHHQSLHTSRWELILVDNCSDPPLAPEVDLSWHQRGRHVREPRLGLTPARVRAIDEAVGDLLIFVDDDNVLDPDYLTLAVEIAGQYPFLGAFGAGCLTPEFETPPEANVRPFLPRLALRASARATWSNNPNDGEACPYGAGLCVTRRTAKAFGRLLSELKTADVLGRRGARLTSNEDDLFTWAATAEGLGVGVFPGLKITHLINARRVSRTFILRLLKDSRFSECLLYYLLTGSQPRRFRPRMMAAVLLAAFRGSFALRCRVAALQGELMASRFIAVHQLQPRAIKSPHRA